MSRPVLFIKTMSALAPKRQPVKQPKLPIPSKILANIRVKNRLGRQRQINRDPYQQSNQSTANAEWYTSEGGQERSMAQVSESREQGDKTVHGDLKSESALHMDKVERIREAMKSFDLAPATEDLQTNATEV